MSSMNTIIRFPPAGPKVSFVRFSTLASRMRWTSMLAVRLEKFMLRMAFAEGSMLFK